MPARDEETTMVTGGIPVLGDLDLWAPLALAGGLSVAVGVGIGLLDRRLRRVLGLARPEPAERATESPPPERKAA
jgi:hypothetical protein